MSRQLLLSEPGCFKTGSSLEVSGNLHLAQELMDGAELQLLAGSGALDAAGEKNGFPISPGNDMGRVTEDKGKIFIVKKSVVGVSPVSMLTHC